MTAAGIEAPAIVAVTRADEGDASAVDRIAAAMADLPVIRVSILDESSLDDLRDAIWRLTGLIRVQLRVGGVTAEEPLALHPPSSVVDVADAVHHDLAATFIGARVWGPSARFDGQRVGRDHEVADRDVVEILS